MVTPFAITTCGILVSSSNGFTKEILKRNIQLFWNYLSSYNINMSSSIKESNFDDIIAYVLDSFQKDHIVSELLTDDRGDDNDESDSDLYILKEEERARINFYKTSIVHYLLPISFVSLAILSTSKDNQTSYKEVEKKIDHLKTLFSKEFIYPGELDNVTTLLENALKYFQKESFITREENKITISNSDGLKIFAKVIQDFLESYFISFSNLAPLHKKRNKKDLIYDIRKSGIKMYHLGEVALLESLSGPNYSNSIEIGEKA